MNDLFQQAGVEVEGQRFWWFLHGRYLQRTRDGWPHGQAKTKSTVIHYDDWISATTEENARQAAIRHHGPPDRHHQWVTFEYIGPVEPEKSGRK